MSPFLGRDSVDPFLAACRRHGAGIFLLVHTSNAGASDIQEATLSDGRPLWHLIANSSPSGVATSSGSAASRASARSSGRPIRGSSARRAAPCRRRSSFSPGRRAGRHAGGRGAGIHRGACERARDRVPFGDLRVPGRGGRLARQPRRAKRRVSPATGGRPRAGSDAAQNEVARAGARRGLRQQVRPRPRRRRPRSAPRRTSSERRWTTRPRGRAAPTAARSRASRS